MTANEILDVPLTLRILLEAAGVGVLVVSVVAIIIALIMARKYP